MQQLNTTLDHLIFGCYSLDEAVDFIDQQLGVQAETGGRHLTMGTYNKLLKLDDTTYFEIIAIDPEGKKPDRPRWFNMDKFGPGSKPQLITWVVRTNDIQQALKESKLQHGVIQSLQRGFYEWQIAIPPDGKMPMQGIAPTIIQWKNDRHPAHTLSDSGISLLNIEALHPDADALMDSLTSIGFKGNFSAKKTGVNERPVLKATLKCPNGVVTLESEITGG